MKTSFYLFFTFGVSFFGLYACGDTIDSKSLNSLSSSETQQLCTAMLNDSLLISKVSCYVGANDEPNNVSMCRECLKNLEDGKEYALASCIDPSVKNFSGCNAAVGTLKDCLHAVASFSSQAIDGITCSEELKKPEKIDLSACNSLISKCPSVFSLED